MKGFTFFYKGKDIFVVTNKKNKTRKLAREILNKMLLPDCPSGIDAILCKLQKAELETKSYGFVINGHNFSISDPEDKTEIIYL